MSYYKERAKALKVLRKTIREALELESNKEGFNLEHFCYQCEISLNFGFPSSFYKKQILKMVEMNDLNAKIYDEIIVPQ